MKLSICSSYFINNKDSENFEMTHTSFYFKILYVSWQQFTLKQKPSAERMSHLIYFV